MQPDKICVSGVEIDPIGKETLLTKMTDYASNGTPALVNYVNVHGMNLAHADASFREALNSSDIVFCDGFGVKLGARILGYRLGERLTPPDWIDLLFERCAAAGHSVYFVGDTQEVVELFVTAVQGRHPEIEVAGHHHGFFELDGAEAKSLMSDLRAKRPAFVVTGMGMPRQETWAREAKCELDHGVYLATGALFRYYSGYERRAPRWMTDHGLEWLARLVASPRKLWHRYFVGNPRFLLRMIGLRLRGLGARR
ncbi:MAG: WecB/TagA/CpsF family glycosyltransferase [Planctomycetota bacterium]